MPHPVLPLSTLNSAPKNVHFLVLNERHIYWRVTYGRHGPQSMAKMKLSSTIGRPQAPIAAFALSGWPESCPLSLGYPLTRLTRVRMSSKAEIFCNFWNLHLRRENCRQHIKLSPQLMIYIESKYSTYKQTQAKFLLTYTINLSLQELDAQILL